MLELKNIKKYYGKRLILDDINLTVNDGEIVSIVGPSGGGKTTLLRCISGLESIDSGDILIDASPFDPYHNNTNESVIGVVFQEFQLFPHLSVLDNITLAPKLVLNRNKVQAEEEAQKLLDRLSLGNKGHLYPYQLSGGQKQRVAIARALAMNPKILCYDEPTSALDPALRQEVENLILSLKVDGMTQIIVTHDVPFAENIADKLLKVKPLED